MDGMLISDKPPPERLPKVLSGCASDKIAYQSHRTYPIIEMTWDTWTPGKVFRSASTSVS
jgi:hypothetical protein